MSVGTAELADGAVTVPKMALGASVQGVAHQERTSTVACSGLNNEQLYLEYTWTSRGGFYVILGGLHVVFGVDSAAPAPGFAMNLRLDGTAGVATDGAIQAYSWFQDATTSAGAIYAPSGLSLGFAGYALSVGVHRVKITGIPINRFVGYAHITSGWSLVVEFA